MFSLHELNYEIKLLRTLYNEKTRKIFFRMKKPHKIFFAQKNNAKFYLHVGWAFENYQLLDAGMLLLLLQKKCENHRACCDYLVAAACQDGSAWNERKKAKTFLSAGLKYGLRFVKKLCTHVQVLGVVAMAKDERQGCNASYCWQQLLLFSVEL